jgi:predicted CopG family antitoxin
MQTFMHMPSKNVAVRMDVYQALKRELRPGESFTKLFVRLLNQRGPLDDLVGSWGGRPSEGLHRRWKQLRTGGRDT